MRRRAFLAAVGTSALAGCSAFDGLGGDTGPPTGESCELDRSRERGSEGWPSLRGDPRNTGSVPTADAPTPPLELDWVVGMSGLAGTVQPSVVGDTVNTSNYDDTLHALAAGSGERRWRHTVEDVYPGQAVVGDLVSRVRGALRRVRVGRRRKRSQTLPGPDYERRRGDGHRGDDGTGRA